jgi:hypothetical protein
MPATKVYTVREALTILLGQVNYLAGNCDITEATKRMARRALKAPDQTVVEWHTDNPPKCGYYLATWKSDDSDKKVVSELWYNPGSGWCSARGYFPHQGLNSPVYIEIAGIIAWAYLPKAFQQPDENA